MAYTPGVGRVSQALFEHPEDVPPPHDQGQLGRRRHRRIRRARSRQHRPDGGLARHGGQGGPLQALRRHRRVADLPRHERTSTRSCAPSASSLRASAESTSRTSRRRAASRSRPSCASGPRIPVFHDDQHGTAIVVLAALKNALRCIDKKLSRRQDRRLRRWGGRLRPSSSCCWQPAPPSTSRCPDRAGPAQPRGRALTPRGAPLADKTNPRGLTGTLRDALSGRRRLRRRQRPPHPPARVDRRDGRQAHRLRARQPRPRGRHLRGEPSGRRSWPPAEATTPTRSTTCWRSRASSAACSTRARPT